MQSKKKKGVLGPVLLLLLLTTGLGSMGVVNYKYYTEYAEINTELQRTSETLEQINEVLPRVKKASENTPQLNALLRIEKIRDTVRDFNDGIFGKARLSQRERVVSSPVPGVRGVTTKYHSTLIEISISNLTNLEHLWPLMTKLENWGQLKKVTFTPNRYELSYEIRKTVEG